MYSKHNDVEKDKTIILCKEVIRRRTMLSVQLANPYTHGESSPQAKPKSLFQESMISHRTRKEVSFGRNDSKYY